MANTGSNTAYIVEFPGQYGNPDRERECTCDRFGAWKTETGGHMPPPKEVARGFYIRLICAPQSVVDGMKK